MPLVIRTSRILAAENRGKPGQTAGKAVAAPGCYFQGGIHAPKHSSEAALEAACRSAIKLFVASLLALVSAGLAFLRQSVGGMPDALATPIFVLHWLFLALALALFLVAILSMLSHARLT